MKSLVFTGAIVAFMLLGVDSAKTLNGKTYKKIDVQSLRKLQNQYGIQQSIFNVDEIVQAIKANKKSFSHQDLNLELTNGNTGDFHAFSSQIIHHTKFTFNFLQNVSLHLLSQLNSLTTFREISSHAIHHCPKSESIDYSINVGDVLLLSENGYQELKDMHNLLSENFRSYISSPEVTRNKGFLLLRKVKSITSTASIHAHETGSAATMADSVLLSSERVSHCHALETEDVTPIELFESFIVDSKFNSPFRHQYPGGAVPLSTILGNADTTQTSQSPAYGPSDPTEIQLQRLSAQTDILPQSPLISCTDNYLGGKPVQITTNNLGYAVAPNGRCIEFVQTLTGSMDINYDYSTGRSISPEFTILPGLICYDCFMYFGNDYGFVAEYQASDSSFTFEAEMNGGAGFNLNLELDNPSFQGAVNLPLITPTSLYSYTTITTGLVLGIKFGGLNATVSSSGRAVGKALISSGAFGIAYLEAKIEDEQLDLSTVNSTLFFNPGNITSSGFSTEDYELNVTIASSIEMTLSIGVDVNSEVASVDFQVNFIPSLSYSAPGNSSAEHLYSASRKLTELEIDRATNSILDHSNHRALSTCTDPKAPALLTFSLAASVTMEEITALSNNLALPPQRTVDLVSPVQSCVQGYISSAIASTSPGGGSLHTESSTVSRLTEQIESQPNKTSFNFNLLIVISALPFLIAMMWYWFRGATNSRTDVMGKVMTTGGVDVPKTNFTRPDSPTTSGLGDSTVIPNSVIDVLWSTPKINSRKSNFPIKH